MKTVIFQEGVTFISNCFGGNTQLEKIVFPSTLEVIPSGLCNAGLSSLKDVVLTPGIKELGSSAFGSCPALTAIDIPGSVETIGDVVFQNCTNLKTVTMHEGTKMMGNSNFANTALESFTFPGTIEVVNSSNYKMVPKIVTIGTNGADANDMAQLQTAIATRDVGTVKAVAAAILAAKKAAGTEGAEAAAMAAQAAADAASAQLQQQQQPEVIEDVEAVATD